MAKINAIEELYVKTDVTTESISLSEAREWLKLEASFTDDDTMITALIKAARQMVEAYTGVGVSSKTYVCTLVNDLGDVELPYPPVTSITSVVDADGDALTNEVGYEFKGTKIKRLLYPDYCTVEYVSGYSSANIPEGLKRAVLAQLAYMYERRGDDPEGYGLSKDAKVWADTFKRTGAW